MLEATAVTVTAIAVAAVVGTVVAAVGLGTGD